MNLKISKPICFFDLETTGINISLDRIVEISILKVFPNGNKESKTWLVNPGIPIPLEVSNIHGITNDTVKNKPSFKSIASDVKSMLQNCDLAGFNSNKFDIPLLAEELLRSDIDFSLENISTVDVQNIFHKMEQRTLSAAYKFYCGKSLENAHSSKADTLATFEVLESQIQKYPDLQNDIKFLSEFSTRGKNVDLAGFIKYNEDDIPCFSFGKHKGKTVDYILKNEPGYFGWLLNADFPMYTKKVLTQLRLNKLNNKL
ncbi:exonuclease domain-containing protein [Flavobacteriaceae bacterium]|mgnify:CR=1 FL=1|jgi:DNA polymerase-3 subunit epsilon|nr:exonuclease domain-containing protein [Flavobacteriaceae bacterium]|tara:strand:+ start:1981 stop:2754 length:774 start_codon:yes stop_codon:yes gene_type:complete